MMSTNSLRDFVGKRVTLQELPFGYSSDDSQVKIGEEYLIKDLSGSCLMIVLPDGSTEFLYYKRFKELAHL